MSRFNTGNPLDSNDLKDLSDNAKNMDLAANSDMDTFQDRLGRSRLTWAGVVKAGTGDPAIAVAAAARAEAAASTAETAADNVEQNAEQIAQDAAQQAVQDVVAGVDGAVDRAEGAAVRAETARDAAFVNADVYPDVATGRAAVAVGEQFQVLSTDGFEYIRYRKISVSAQTEVGRYPSAELVRYSGALLIPAAPSNINFDTVAGQLVVNGTVYIATKKTTIVVPAQTVPFPTVIGSHRLMYDPVARKFSFLLAQAAASPNMLSFGWVRRSATGTYEVLGFDGVNIDGAAPEYNPIPYRGELVATGPSGIAFDFDARTLTLSGVRVRYKNLATVVPDQVVTLAISGTAVLVYNENTSLVRSISSTTGLSTGDIKVGTYVPFSRLVHGIALYTINGQSPFTYDRGELVTETPSKVNFKFSENKLVLGDVRVNRGPQLTDLITPQEVTLSGGAAVQNLIYNPATGLITSKAAALGVYAYGDVQIGSYINDAEPRVIDIGVYSINGVDASPTRTPLTQAYFTVVNGVTDASYVQPELSGFEWIMVADHKDMYALYDELVNDYPEYVTRTLMGQDTIGNDLFRYDFKPPSFREESAEYPGTAKMILVTGVHGYEKAGIYTTYSAMKEICTRWQDDERLETLRWGVHFIVVPVASPYGFDNNTRVNERGVDMDRNFPTDWDRGISDPESGEYRGPSPLSEPVVGYIDEILSQNTDALYYCSFHNMENADYFIWNASATRFGVQAAQRLSSRLTVSWDKRYTRTSAGGYIGYSSFGAPVGSSPAHAAKKYNIQAGTFEISRRVGMYGDNTLWGPMVATLGTETFINWLLINLEYGAQLKNSSVRIVG